MRIPWLKLYVFLILILLFVPLVLIIIFSFNNSMLGTFPLMGFTLRWYQEAFSRRLYLLGFRYSAIVAAVSSVGAGILGTLAAYGLNRYKPRLSGMITGMLTIPILIPGLVLGISMLSYFYFFGVPRSLATVILAHIVFSTPYVVLILNARFHHFDWSIEDAARDLGASPWTAFWLITVPLSKAGIIAGSMLVFIPCIGEYVIPEMLGGPRVLMIGRVLWNEFSSNNDWPMASAVAVAVILLILVPLAWFNKVQAEATGGRA